MPKNDFAVVHDPHSGRCPRRHVRPAAGARLPIELSHYQATHPDVPPGITYNHAVGIVEPSEYGPDEKGWYERGQLFIGAEAATAPSNSRGPRRSGILE
jgi:hypothetical protein